MITERLKKLDTCAVSDSLDHFSLNGVACGIKRLATKEKITGRVITIKLKPCDNKPSETHLGTKAIELAEAGDIIVVDNEGKTDMAGWGGLLSRAAKIKQISGVLIDGACRDIDEAEEVSFPVFAKAGTPVTARKRIREEATNTEIQICGIKVKPGDFLIADGSGAVFIPRERAEEIITFAEKIAEKEKLLSDLFLKGKAITEILGRNYEKMLDKNDL